MILHNFDATIYRIHIYVHMKPFEDDKNRFIIFFAIKKWNKSSPFKKIVRVLLNWISQFTTLRSCAFILCSLTFFNSGIVVFDLAGDKLLFYHPYTCEQDTIHEKHLLDTLCQSISLSPCHTPSHPHTYKHKPTLKNVYTIWTKNRELEYVLNNICLLCSICGVFIFSYIFYVYFFDVFRCLHK